MNGITNRWLTTGVVSATYSGVFGQLHVSAVQRLVGLFLGLHLQDRARNQEQDVRGDRRHLPPKRKVKLGHTPRTGQILS